MRVSSFYGVCILCGVLGWAAAAEMRIAIVPEDQVADQASLLESELSGVKGIELLERQSIEAVLNEMTLQRTVGGGSDINLSDQVGADALLFMGRSEFEGELGIRLSMVSVQNGLILYSKTVPVEQFNDLKTKELADRIYSRRFVLQLDRSQVTGISLAGVNGVNNASRRVEPLVNELLLDALGDLEGVYLLDRRRTAELQWEKVLMQAGEEFWKASLVVSGDLTKTDQDFRLKLNVLVPGESVSRTVQGRDENPFTLARNMAYQIQEKGGRSRAVRFNRSELEVFQERVQEKYRVRNYGEALSAAVAAHALGSKDPEMIRTWARSIMELGARRSSDGTSLGGAENTHFLFSRYTTESILAAQESIELLLREVPLPEASRERVAWIHCAEDLVLDASRILQSSYYQPRPIGPYSDEALAGLRSSVRRVMNTLIDEYHERVDAGASEDSFSWDMLKYIGRYNGFWHDEPDAWRDMFDFYLSSLDVKDAQGDFRSTLLDGAVGATRSDYTPLVVVWNPRRANEFREAFEDLLLQRCSTGRTVDKIRALQLRLSPICFAHFSFQGNRMGVRKVDQVTYDRFHRFDAVKTAQYFQLYCDVLWLGRSEYVSGEMHWLQLGRHISFAERLMGSLEDTPYAEEARKTYAALRKNLFVYFADRAATLHFRYFDVYEPAFRTEPGEEIRALLLKVAELHPQLRPAFDEVILGLNYGISSEATTSDKQPVAPPAERLPVKRVLHQLGDAHTVLQTDSGIMMAFSKENHRRSSYHRFITFLHNSPDGNETYQGFEFAVQKHKTEASWRERSDGGMEYVLPENTLYGEVLWGPFAAFRESHFYMASEKGIEKRPDLTSDIETFSSPIPHDAVLFQSGGHLYLMGRDNRVISIAQFDPETESFRQLPRFTQMRGERGFGIVNVVESPGKIQLIHQDGSLWSLDDLGQRWIQNPPPSKETSFEDMISIFSAQATRYPGKAQLVKSLAGLLLETEPVQQILPPSSRRFEAHMVSDIYTSGEHLAMLVQQGGMGLQILNFAEGRSQFFDLTVEDHPDPDVKDTDLRIACINDSIVALIHPKTSGVYVIHLPLAREKQEVH